MTEKTSENETQSVLESAKKSALSSCKIIESGKNEFAKNAPEKLSYENESAVKTSKNSFDVTKEEKPIDVFAKLEEFLFDIASRTP